MVKAAARTLCLLAAVALLSGCDGGELSPPSQPDAPLPLSSTAPPASPLPPDSSNRVLFVQNEPQPFLEALASPCVYPMTTPPLGGVVPHHLIASDMIAGFFQAVSPFADEYDSVILLGPSHFPQNCASDVVTSTADWSTPEGKLLTNQALTGQILSEPRIHAENNPDAMSMDHGITGLIPFIRHYLPEVQVTTCLLSTQLSLQRLEALEDVLEGAMAGGRTLLVVSMDASHYLMPDQAALHDTATVQAVLAGDRTQILSFTDSNMDTPESLAALVSLCQKLGAIPHFLDHSDSTDKLPHNLSDSIYSEGITSYFVIAAFTP